MSKRFTHAAVSAAFIALGWAGATTGLAPAEAAPATPFARHAPAPAPAPAQDWGYLGDLGPSHWGELGYPLCEQGQNQSPIDITRTNSGGWPNPSFDYGKVRVTLAATGHGVKVAPEPGAAPNTVAHQGKEYTFQQFHHHAPSEHQIDGLHFPAEVHFVNRAEDGSLAVFGVLVRGGGHTNRAWEPILDVITEATTDPSATIARVDLDRLLPGDRRSYRYEGSLTTPPCTEGVVWTVFTQPIVLSNDQVATLMEAYQGNARPAQDRNSRVVLYDRSPGR